MVGTKADLLPAGTDLAAVAEWLQAAATYKRINAVSVHLVRGVGGLLGGWVTAWLAAQPVLEGLVRVVSAWKAGCWVAGWLEAYNGLPGCWGSFGWKLGWLNAGRCLLLRAGWLADACPSACTHVRFKLPVPHTNHCLELALPLAPLLAAGQQPDGRGSAPCGGRHTKGAEGAGCLRGGGRQRGQERIHSGAGQVSAWGGCCVVVVIIKMIMIALAYLSAGMASWHPSATCKACLQGWEAGMPAGHMHKRVRRPPASLRDRPLPPLISTVHPASNCGTSHHRQLHTQ